MLVHIQRDGQQFGPYTLEDLNAHLASGALLPTDYAWYEGAANWMAMSDVPGVVLPGVALVSPNSPMVPVDPTFSVQSGGAAVEGSNKSNVTIIAIVGLTIAIASLVIAIVAWGTGYWKPAILVKEEAEKPTIVRGGNRVDNVGSSAQGEALFAKDVVPILRKHKCFNCHSAKESNKVEADLDFSVPSTMRAFLSPNQPGNPATTPLVLAVTAAPGEGRPMPPTGPRMSDAEVDVIKAWIAAGAKY